MDTQLIDTYISEVGRQLTGKNKKDIEAEIHSALQDILEERSKKIGKPADQKMVLAVLQEYGSPEKVAASYQGERYLIGPRLYPVFLKVIQIVLPIIGILTLVGMGISFAHLGGTAGQDAWTTLGRFGTIIAQAVSDFIGTVISTLGGITLGFALLERFVPDFEMGEKKEWQARSLLKITKPDKLNQGELIVEIVFTAIGILIFNFYPQVVGFTPSLNSVVETGSWKNILFFPILSEAFFRYIPYLTVLWVATIILDGILLQRNRWETWTRGIYLCLKVLFITMTVVMLTGPSLISLTSDSLVASGVFTRDAANILMTVLDQVIRGVLILSIILQGVDLGKGIYQFFKSQIQHQAAV